MADRKLLGIGLLGAAVSALCCFTPVLVLLLAGLGLWKLALGAVQKPWGIFNVLSFGMLLVVLVIAGYTGVFLALMTLTLKL